MCFKKKFNADRHLNNVHSNVIDDAKKSVDIEENYHSPSKYFKADGEHSDMALLETDDSILCSPASKQPLTFNFHELSADIIQQLPTSEKNTRKNKTSLGETDKYDHISDEEIDSDDAKATSAEEDEEDIPDLDDDWLFNNSGQNCSNITTKEHGTIGLVYSVRHKNTGQAIKDLLKLINIHVPENSHTFNSTDTLRNVIGKLLGSVKSHFKGGNSYFQWLFSSLFQETYIHENTDFSCDIGYLFFIPLATYQTYIAPLILMFDDKTFD